jgi:two-component system, OmpR family, alkaline phosphatase synthesis response regulator PhoP
MAKEKILVVEDDEDILELLRYNLAKEGYDLVTAETGEEGLKQAFASLPHLICLDLMLPGMDGLEVCKRLKQDPRTENVPIVMVTAKGEEADIVAGLELGADDYVTKPFSPRVLIARVRSVLRRKKRETVSESDSLRIGILAIHPGRHEVLVDGKPLDLTYTEFKLLHLLARRPGWVFTRYQIVDSVRGQNYPVTERSVDVQVAGLRKKLGSAAEYIETVRGIGYRFRE